MKSVSGSEKFVEDITVLPKANTLLNISTALLFYSQLYSIIG